MSDLVRARRLVFAVPLLCTLGAGGCSLDFLLISFCATEQQSFAIDGPSSFTSSHGSGGLSVAVGDSVHLVGHGFCRDAGLHVVIAGSSAQWHSHDNSIVRISPAADSSAMNGDPMPTAWAVGVRTGETVVSGELGGSVASVAVKVAAR